MYWLCEGSETPHSHLNLAIQASTSPPPQHDNITISQPHKANKQQSSWSNDLHYHYFVYNIYT